MAAPYTVGQLDQQGFQSWDPSDAIILLRSVVS